MEGTCIYCGVQGDMSREHYLSDALGDFGSGQILDGVLCRDCNSAIGNATETQFLRTGPIALFRWILGIEGTNGKPPPPFYRGAGGAPPILTFTRLPGEDHDTLCEIEWATRNVRAARQVVFQDAALGRVPILITDRILVDPGSLPAALAARGIPDAVPVAVWAEPAEEAAVQLIIRQNYGQRLSCPLPVIEPPQGGQIRLTTQVEVGPPFFRAVAKIVFHYMLKVFPEIDGAASQFQPIRDYIRDGTGEGFVTELRNQVIGNFRAGQRPTEWSHFLCAERNASGILGFGQFFVSPESLPRPFRVRISNRAPRILVPTERRAHQFVIHTIEGGGRPRGEMVDLQPISRIVVPF